MANTFITPIEFLTDSIRAQSLGNLQGFPVTGGTITGPVVIQGNLTIMGSQTFIESTLVNVQNNIITLNSTVTGTPVLNAALQVQRGNQPRASLLWNESLMEWQIGLAGSEQTVLNTGASLSGDVTGTLGNTVIGPGVITSAMIGNNTVTYGNIQQEGANTFLCNPTGSAANIQEQPITALGFTILAQSTPAAVRVAINTVGKSAGTLPAGNMSAVFVHGLNTTDINVTIVDLSDNTITEAEVVVSSANSITLTFSNNIPANTYRVIVIG